MKFVQLTACFVSEYSNKNNLTNLKESFSSSTCFLKLLQTVIYQIHSPEVYQGNCITIKIEPHKNKYFSFNLESQSSVFLLTINSVL